MSCITEILKLKGDQEVLVPDGKWKGKMWVDGKPNQHRLGIAKEKLKTMICGE